MREAPRVLLVNPSMTPARNARFPLAILNLAAALEGRYPNRLIDGNVDRDFIASAVRAVSSGEVDALAVSVMGGPQLPPAIALSKAMRAAAPQVPIIWGGAFPTNCPDATLNTSYVDYAVRAQGEETFTQLLGALEGGASESLGDIAGLSWRFNGHTLHNKERAFSGLSLERRVPYERLANPQQLPDAHLSRPSHRRLPGRTGLPLSLHLLRGCDHVPRPPALPTAARLEQDLTFLTHAARRGRDPVLRPQLLRSRGRHGAAARSAGALSAAVVVLRALGCTAEPVRAARWELVRRAACAWPTSAPSRPSDWLLHDMRKGTRSDQTLDAVELCHAQRRDPGAVLHARAAAGPGGGNRAHLRVHPPHQARATRTPRSCCTSTRRCRRAPALTPGARARRLTCATAPGQRWSSRPPPTAGRCRSGARTGVTRTRRGFPSACGCGSAISPPCWAAAIRPSPTSARRSGASSRCGRWRRGATASAPLPSSVGTGPVEEVHPPA